MMAVDFLKKCYSHLKAGEPGQRLTAIFFIGRGRRRHLDIPTVMVLGAAGLMGGTLVWALMSFGVLSGLWLENNHLEAELKSLQQGMFDYQVRYDQVFERAYFVPNSDDLNLSGPRLGPVSEALQAPPNELLSLTEGLPGKQQIPGTTMTKGDESDPQGGVPPRAENSVRAQPLLPPAAVNPMQQMGIHPPAEGGNLSPEETAVADQGGDYVETVKGGKSADIKGMPQAVRAVESPAAKSESPTIPPKTVEAPVAVVADESADTAVPATHTSKDTPAGLHAPDSKVPEKAQPATSLKLKASRVQNTGSTLVIPTTLRNSNPGAPTAGYIWAVVELKGEGPGPQKLVYPANLALDVNGQPSNLSSLTAVQVEKAWKGRLEMAIPAESKNRRVASIRVMVSDGAGKIVAQQSLGVPPRL